jgi:DNA-directed RNA polymerase subunit RPC12/RpoP
VSGFAIPDVLQHVRTCRECGQPWRVYCAFGAEEPPHDRYYRCPDCRTPVGEATPELIAKIEGRRAQLSIVKDDHVE